MTDPEPDSTDTPDVVIVVDNAPDLDPEPDPAPDTTVVVVDSSDPDPSPEIDRFVEIESRFGQLESRLDGHDQAISELTIHDIVEDAEDDIDDEPIVVEEAEPTDDSTEDEIEPRRSHPWFRPMREWFS